MSLTEELNADQAFKLMDDPNGWEARTNQGGKWYPFEEWSKWSFAQLQKYGKFRCAAMHFEQKTTVQRSIHGLSDLLGPKWFGKRVELSVRQIFDDPEPAPVAPPAPAETPECRMPRTATFSPAPLTDQTVVRACLDKHRCELTVYLEESWIGRSVEVSILEILNNPQMDLPTALAWMMRNPNKSLRSCRGGEFKIESFSRHLMMRNPPGRVPGYWSVWPTSSISVSDVFTILEDTDSG